MNCFLVLLILILIVGLAITQLALNFYTEGWLWPVLHGALFLVSTVSNKTNHFHSHNPLIFKLFSYLFWHFG